ncbi:hypothetical protein O6H91_12G018700 [Diphasiastrum complanatum]|uniref:Uncharacterized protein n=1 Tax=Diphasiastrum complanatum TaxID=34168 RepID=A0ACC2BZA9_DIPCM|nr:hypothetical protein O6H91_12G018700 [Diphasiastrum complanatum]
MEANTKSVVGRKKSDMNRESEKEKDKDGGRSSPKQFSRPPRSTSSKYDFVKVRVWLGESADHYYVLSRFLLSRMLTVTKIPNHVAIKIALELKKLLVDNSLLDVSQSDLEANLFKLMERRGYGEEYINRYKMMTRLFHHQRVPLIIVVCGTACVGKSTIATQLAQRLNLPNVLQTDMVYELLRTSTDAPLTSTPIWEREFQSPEELLTEFCRECRIVRKGLDGDLRKAMKDGKPIIIEGIHLDPTIYLMENESGGQTCTNGNVKGKDENKFTLTGQGLDNSVMPFAALSFSKYDASISDVSSRGLMEAGVENKYIARSKVAQNTIAINSKEASLMQHDIIKSCTTKSIGTTLDEAGTMHEETSLENNLKPATKAIIVPIVLKMVENDHQMLLEEWITCRSGNGASMSEIQKETCINKLKIIQEYLCSFESQGATVVKISATTFPQTLDWLHSHLLQCIEEGFQSAITQVTP